METAFERSAHAGEISSRGSEEVMTQASRDVVALAAAAASGDAAALQSLLGLWAGYTGRPFHEMPYHLDAAVEVPVEAARVRQALQPRA
jgi:alkylhydroperoxidase/carboxymuconolactone decarboxylase family protein YurZ